MLWNQNNSNVMTIKRLRKTFIIALEISKFSSCNINYHHVKDDWCLDRMNRPCR